MKKKKKQKQTRQPEYIACELYSGSYFGSTSWHEYTKEELIAVIRDKGQHFKYVFKIIDQVPVQIDISLEKEEIQCQEMN